jgi:hypothetical protein
VNCSETNDSKILGPVFSCPDCAAISLRSIVFDGEPILHVTHDLDDDGWQFLGGGDAEMDDAAVVSMAEIVALDSTVVAVADLPPGAEAAREWNRRAGEQ